MILLLRSKNAVEDGRGRRRQLLTMVEHWVLFYRACISTPFWFVHLYQGGFVSSIFTGGATSLRRQMCNPSDSKKMLEAMKVTCDVLSIVLGLLTPARRPGAYLVTKCGLIYKRSTALLASVQMVWRRDAQHGKYVSQEELLELGTSCPICQVRL